MAGCKYALVDCIAGCGQRIQRRKITDHVKKDCVKRWVKCPLCKKETTFEKLQVRRIIIYWLLLGKAMPPIPQNSNVFIVLTVQLGFSVGNAL